MKKTLLFLFINLLFGVVFFISAPIDAIAGLIYLDDQYYSISKELENYSPNISKSYNDSSTKSIRFLVEGWTELVDVTFEAPHLRCFATVWTAKGGDGADYGSSEASLAWSVSGTKVGGFIHTFYEQSLPVTGSGQSSVETWDPIEIKGVVPGQIYEIELTFSWNLYTFNAWTDDEGYSPWDGVETYYTGQADFTGGYTIETSEVPIPSAIWLLGSGLIGLVGLRRKLREA